ncbi:MULTISPECIES: hypothetical protein [Streptomyces]|uniref:hypothetical protein n=1 Tax=Streptomyces TaxID=1883 RepID=UPI0029A0FB84|nr:hypothetical protein [Streptomyces sp. ME02-6979.5a]MDX3343562.1 hypothetical protein [Streptomyces sp. ME02-6979.5a]
MSESKDRTRSEAGDDRLSEPSKLPLSPDELARHNVLPGWEGRYAAPPADSYVDPLDRPPLQAAPPLFPGQDQAPPLLRPPGQQAPYGPGLPGSPGTPGTPPGADLKIAPSVLSKAAGRADEIYDAFYKPAAGLEEAALKALAALQGWESHDAVRLAHRQWERQAGTVTAWLARIAESLRVADSTYTKTDMKVDEDMRQVRARSKLEDF